MTGLYFACLNLAGRDTLVAGGGAVAHRKVVSLLRAGARVTVVSPRLSPRLSRLVGSPNLRIRRRKYRAGDLRGRWLVIAATGDADANRRIFEDSSRARVFCNVVDQPELCTFQVPAIVRRGRLQIAISTAGASPILAREIRRQLEAQFGRAYSELLGVLADLRKCLRKKHPNDPAQRRKLLEKFVETSVRPMFLKRPDPKALRREVERWKSL